MSAAKYTSDDVADAERPVKVCAEAGRKCVRSIHQFDILSREWLGVVDSLKQLARLVQLEERMPSAAKGSDTLGRNVDSDGTLWDQDTHENAIRILVEEAKVNLCLRIMNDFKKWHYDSSQRAATISRAMQEYELSEAALAQKTKTFEESLGLLLWRAFIHVETLQLMDIPLLVEHCALVLNHCEYELPEKLNCSPKEQEMLVMYYATSLFKHAEALNNSEVLARIRESRLLPLAVSHIVNHAANEYSDDFALDLALGFSALCENEDFQTDFESFFQLPDMAKFMDLQQLLVEPILARSPEKKKDLRPLCDFFRALARKM